MKAQKLYDKLWDTHVVRQEADGTALIYIDRHLVHEVTSPQAFEGLKLAGRKLWRTASILAVADHNVPTTGRAQGIADPVSRLQVETLDTNCAEFGVTRIQDDRYAPGHRACDRAGAGRDLAGHDGGVRRFAYQHARRVRRAGIRDRHVRGRACDGDAMSADEKIQSHAGGGGRRAGQGRHRQGYRAGRDRQDRHGRRHRLCHRVRRQCDPLPFDGRAHDLVQHGDRSRCARRHGRGGRHDHRLSQGSSVCAARRVMGQGRGILAHFAQRCRARSSTRWSDWMPHRSGRK